MKGDQKLNVPKQMYSIVANFNAKNLKKSYEDTI